MRGARTLLDARVVSASALVDALIAEVSPRALLTGLHHCYRRAKPYQVGRQVKVIGARVPHPGATGVIDRVQTASFGNGDYPMYWVNLDGGRGSLPYDAAELEPISMAEGESAKKALKALAARPITPRKFMWKEIERIGHVLACGPCSTRKGDHRFIDCGLFQYYEMCGDDGNWKPDPAVVDSAPGAVEAFYAKNGGVREEWIAEPSMRRGVMRTYEWPRVQEAESAKRFLQTAPRFKAVTVVSTHGEFHTDTSGFVYRWVPDDPDDPESARYANIDYFDFREWRAFYNKAVVPGVVDLLDVGFTLKDGTYEPPDAECRAER